MQVIRSKNLLLFWFFSISIFIYIFLASLVTGALHISIGELWSNFLLIDDSVNSLLIHEIRLPRSVAASLCGAALAVSGAVLQIVIRNPLGCPSLLGINQGSAFALVILLLLFPAAAVILFAPVAFIGGILTAFLTYQIAASPTVTPMRLALAGVTVNALFYAFMQGALILFPDRAQGIIFNLSGSFAGVTWLQLKFTIPLIIFSLIIMFFLQSRLTILMLGEEQADSIGVSYRSNLIGFLLLAIVLATSAVSIGGPISFLGLLVPHGLKAFMATNNKQFLVLCALWGGIALLASDLLVHFANPIEETPVGILLALFGTPILLAIVRK